MNVRLAALAMGTATAIGSFVAASALMAWLLPPLGTPGRIWWFVPVALIYTLAGWLVAVPFGRLSWWVGAAAAAAELVALGAVTAVGASLLLGALVGNCWISRRRRMTPDL